MPKDRTPLRDHDGSMLPTWSTWSGLRSTDRQEGERRVGQWLYQDQLAPIAGLDAAGNVVTRFVYGTRAHVPDYLIKGGVTYRVVSDHLGSTRLIVDVATGAVAQELRYDEFGRVLLDTNPGFQPFGFAGGLYDGQTGLVRFGARDYDPVAGRWTDLDPVGFDGGSANLYEYVFSNPLTFVDPTGKTACDDLTKLLVQISENVPTVGKKPLGASMVGLARLMRRDSDRLGHDGFRPSLVASGQNGDVWAHVTGNAGTVLLGEMGDQIAEYQNNDDIRDLEMRDAHSPQAFAEIEGNRSGRLAGRVLGKLVDDQISPSEARQKIHDILCKDTNSCSL
jgi:RHS repeat-associated protein